MKITFINPNSEDVVDKYLPEILAEAVLNKVNKELNEAEMDRNEYEVKHSA